MLILDICANNIQTCQADSQVELTQLQYLSPRQRVLSTHLERQQGGIGTRNHEEQAIETDRRKVRDLIKKLRDRLDKIELQGKSRRKNRGQYIRVELVGYTNVGKSNHMNRINISDVLKDKHYIKNI